MRGDAFIDGRREACEIGETRFHGGGYPGHFGGNGKGIQRERERSRGRGVRKLMESVGFG